MPNSVPKLCADLGIEIVELSESVGSGQTSARGTLNRLHRNYGDAHLVTVLRVFTETENTAARIDAFALWAVSDVILAHPEWPGSGLRWLEIMDRIDISEIQRQAKANREAVPQRHAIATMLHRELSIAFSRPAGGEKEENIVAIDNDLLYGTKAIASYLEIPIQRCRELLAGGKMPSFCMPGSTTRCARKSSLNALWAEYELAGSARAAAG